MSRSISGEYYTSKGKAIPVKWTAPEAVQFGKFTHASDVWSFGVVLWELFSRGMIPYPGMENSEVIRKITNGVRLEKPRDCPNEVYDLMLKCWAEKPKERPKFTGTSKCFIVDNVNRYTCNAHHVIATFRCN